MLSKGFSMFSSLKYFQMLLWIFWISQASATITEIYAEDEMSKVHLPCVSVQTELSKHEEAPKMEAMWIRKDKKIIVKDENGVRETFRRLKMSGPVKSHENLTNLTNLTNVRYYGRVNFSASYGLIINNVKADDGGTYLCRYKTTDTLASGKSEVKLVVFNASATITEIYADSGMSKVHIPCFALETELSKQEAPPKIESMWTREDKKIIVKDENGIRETFRRLTLSGPVQSNANLTNVQYYGRVNFSASYGLVINNVKADDGGTYLCRYITTDTLASGKSEVKLVVNEPSTIINDTFNTSFVNDTTEPSTIIIDTFTTSLVNDTTDNHSEDSSCIIWKAVVGVLAVSFTSLLLGGVLKQCWPYIKRVWLLTHAAGGNDRTDDSDQPEENHVLNEFAGVDGQSIPNGSPCIAHAITRPSKGMGNCVSNENASAQCIPQVSSGSPRIRNGYVVGNTEDRSIPQVGNTHPSDDDLENCVSSGYAADKAKAQRIPEGLTIAYPNGNYRYYYN